MKKRNSNKPEKRSNTLTIQPNTAQTASVPSCVLLLAPQLRNSMRLKRKGTFHPPEYRGQNITKK